MVCDGCPIFKDGYRSFSMCSPLDCWNEYMQEDKKDV